MAMLDEGTVSLGVNPIKVSLVYSVAPRQVREWTLELPSGTSLAQALAQSGVFSEFPKLQTGCLMIGVWGKKRSLSYVLSNLDRIEIYRNLRVDPKVARRERFNTQSAKSAGLFVKTRLGAIAGY